ncbi:CRISPR-associated primase-polymerase type A1 [Heliophilum fasciatum]|nr:CRISPR-associated primase-polymerase type A1 [Heliophilum fasciatum]MCW2279370.1 group II intron reverse transcriptase/maturase [Heliophilum fasciatum]
MESLIRSAIRLVEWSVRHYGWGPVIGVFVAASLSLGVLGSLPGWMNQDLFLVQWALGAAMLYSIGWALWRGIPRWWAGLVSNEGRTVTGNRFLLPVRGTERLTEERVERWRQEGRVAGEEVGLNRGRAGEPVDLWEKCFSLERLQEAWERVALRGGSPGSDGVTVEAFALDVNRHLVQLRQELCAGTYVPLPMKHFTIPKRSGGLRKLTVFCVRDRVVQLAIHRVLMTLWEPRFAPCSYAYRPGRSALQAVAAVEQLLNRGERWVVDGDIETFFDTVVHRRLNELIREWLPDERLCYLLGRLIEAGAEGRDRGLTQGAALSPVLANLYLHLFDVALTQAGWNLVRYGDDFVILMATRQQAEEALCMVERLIAGLELRLNGSKTTIVHRDSGFTFLGYTFSANGKAPSRAAVESLRERLERAESADKRQRVLAGWQGYFGMRGGSGGGRGVECEEAAETVETRGAMGAVETMRKGEDRGMNGLHQGASGPWTDYRRLFLGRPDVFGQFWQNNEGQQGYMPLYRSLTDQELEAHIRGEVILGTYLLRPEGTTRALVLDVDGVAMGGMAEQKAMEFSWRLTEALHEEGWHPLWFRSGGKGAHIWLCFEHPVAARQVRRFIDGWLDRFRPFPKDVMVEVFPKQDHLGPAAMGSLIRLPMGRHPQTGRWSRLLARDGAVMKHPWEWLRQVPRHDLSRFAWGSDERRGRTVMHEGQGKSTDRSGNGRELRPIVVADELAPLVDGCTWIRGLMEKADREGQLRHGERLALLYVLGGSEAGRSLVHQVMARCANYTPKVTERWLRRITAGHKPVRCSKLQEWLKDHLPGVQCACPVAGQIKTPHDLLRGKTKPVVVLPQEDAWDPVGLDLFGGWDDEVE